MAQNYTASELSKFFITPQTGTLTDVTPYMTDITGLPGKRELSDVTTFGSVGKRWHPSLQNTEFTISLVYSEDTTYGTNTTFGYLRTSASTSAFQFYPAGTTGECIYGNCWLDDYSITSKVGDAVKASLHCKVDNGVTIGVPVFNYIFNPDVDGYISAINGTYATAQAAATGSVDNSSIYNKIGQEYIFSNYYCYRGMYLFNTAALTGKTVQTAQLNLYGALNNSATAFNLVVTNGQPTYPHNPPIAGDYNIANYAGTGGTFASNGYVNGYNTINLTSTGLAWINTTSETKLAVVSSRDISATQPSGEENIWFYTQEQGVGFQPQLVVTAQ